MFKSDCVLSAYYDTDPTDELLKEGDVSLFLSVCSLVISPCKGISFSRIVLGDAFRRAPLLSLAPAESL